MIAPVWRLGTGPGQTAGGQSSPASGGLQAANEPADLRWHRIRRQVRAVPNGQRRMRTTIELNDEVCAPPSAKPPRNRPRCAPSSNGRSALTWPRRKSSGYTLTWRTERGRLQPGVKLDDWDALFDLMEGRSCIALDTNLLVYARREEVPQHAEARTMLEGLAMGDAPWALPLVQVLWIKTSSGTSHASLRVVAGPHRPPRRCSSLAIGPHCALLSPCWERRGLTDNPQIGV